MSCRPSFVGKIFLFFNAESFFETIFIYRFLFHSLYLNMLKPSKFEFYFKTLNVRMAILCPSCHSTFFSKSRSILFNFAFRWTPIPIGPTAAFRLLSDLHSKSDGDFADLRLSGLSVPSDVRILECRIDFSVGYFGSCGSHGGSCCTLRINWCCRPVSILLYAG